MTSDGWLVAGGVLVAIYALERSGLLTNVRALFSGPQLTDRQATNALTNAGLTVSEQSDGSFFVHDPATNTTFRFGEDEAANLNAAQSLLIGLDRIVPGTFLTRWALT